MYPDFASGLSIVEMPGNNFFKLLGVIPLLSAVYGMANADRQSLTSISLQAESFISAYDYATPYPVKVELASLDKRLNLKPCEQALKVSFTRAQKIMGNTSLTIRCESPVNWQIHLPARIMVFDDVLVNKTPLVKGQSIDTNAVEYRKHDITRLHQGFFRRTDPLLNLQAKRNLRAHSILNSANLSARQLVKSGQKVTIILTIDGLQIKTNGLALQSASQGQLIKVRNSSSNKIVEGVVSASGQVIVSL